MSPSEGFQFGLCRCCAGTRHSGSSGSVSGTWGFAAVSAAAAVGSTSHIQTAPHHPTHADGIEDGDRFVAEAKVLGMGPGPGSHQFASGPILGLEGVPCFRQCGIDLLHTLQHRPSLIVVESRRCSQGQDASVREGRRRR